MTDVYLYQGEANPSDVKLTDPTTLAGSSAITGTSDLVAVLATIAVTASLIFSGTADVSASSAIATGTAAQTYSSSSTTAAVNASLSGSAGLTFEASSAVAPAAATSLGVGIVADLAGSSNLSAAAPSFSSDGLVSEQINAGGGTWSPPYRRVPSHRPVVEAPPTITIQTPPVPIPDAITGESSLLAAQALSDGSGTVIVVITGLGQIRSAAARSWAGAQVNTDPIDEEELLALGVM